jgi:hypothetical protein
LLAEHGKQPLHEPLALSEDSDIDMNMSPEVHFDEDSDYVDDGNNPELQQLRLKQRSLKKQLDDPDIPMDDTTHGRDKSDAGVPSFKENYTVIVADTNSLVKHPGMYRQILDSEGWTLVVPYSGSFNLWFIHLMAKLTMS